MQELSVQEVTAVSGGLDLSVDIGGWDFGYGSVPGGGDVNFGNGVTAGKDFGNGWSLDAGFNDKAGGFEVSFVW
ncbi:MAG: hypothetical protein AB7E55_13800 [Pigmentiphaga sp.]